MESLNEVYDYFKFQYLFKLKKDFRKHRQYFSEAHRGFGEDAFHAAWYAIFSEFRPIHCVEVGVYRGQVTSLWSLLQNHFGIDGEIWGLSPLDSVGDQVSQYIPIDYERDIKENFVNFGLAAPNLFKADSNSQEAKDFIGSKKWDLIYIDGGHDEATVRSDVKTACESLKSNGILVLDDSSLYLDYKPSSDAFAGHPGPSNVLRDIAAKKLDHLLTIGHLNVLKKN